MRLWFDTEFHEDGRTIDLISIGIVCEDGRTYHGVSAAYDWRRATPWLLQNVRPHIASMTPVSRDQLRADIAHLIGDAQPEFWAYFGEYDWIALRQLFGDMLNWPKGWPLCHLDIEQWRISLGGVELPPQASSLHDALSDALWTRDSWRYLESIERARR